MINSSNPCNAFKCNIITLLLISHSYSSNAFAVPSRGIKDFSSTVSGIITDSRQRSTNLPSSSLLALHALGNSNDAIGSSAPPPPLPNSSDPYIILDFQPSGQKWALKGEIKRAYKRAAHRYHPDVRINPSSTEEEREVANEDFARINAAYAFLIGKSSDPPTVSKRNVTKKQGVNRTKTATGHGFDFFRKNKAGRRYNRNSDSDKYKYASTYEEYGSSTTQTQNQGGGAYGDGYGYNYTPPSRNRSDWSDFYDSEKFHEKRKPENASPPPQSNSQYASSRTRSSSSANPSSRQSTSSATGGRYSSPSNGQNGKSSAWSDFYDAEQFHNKWKSASSTTARPTSPSSYAPYGQSTDSGEYEFPPGSVSGGFSYTSGSKKNYWGDFFDAEQFHNKWNPTTASTELYQGAPNNMNSGYQGNVGGYNHSQSRSDDYNADQMHNKWNPRSSSSASEQTSSSQYNQNNQGSQSTYDSGTYARTMSYDEASYGYNYTPPPERKSHRWAEFYDADEFHSRYNYSSQPHGN